MKKLFSLLALLCLATTVFGQEAKLDVPKYLQDISVTIQAGRFSGSGVYKTTKDGTVWVLTCGHVIEDIRTSREILDGKGGRKTLIEFGDAKIRQFIKEEGRIVGELNYDAEVIRYSDADFGEDLALLRLRTKQIKPLSSTVFYQDKDIPKVGTELLHCGSLLGEFGSNSVTPGIISQHGRILSGKTYDQTTCVVYPGSSGGPVTLKNDGRYVGMIVRGTLGGFNLMVPIRRIQSWAEKTGVDFILDDAKDIPDENKLRSMPIDTGVIDADVNHKRPPMPTMQFLIHTRPKMSAIVAP